MTKRLTKVQVRQLDALHGSMIRVQNENYRQNMFVERLRADGVPWELIGQYLGISKQGAQQRFGA